MAVTVVLGGTERSPAVMPVEGELLQAIELKRAELARVVAQAGGNLQHPTVLARSAELDELIVASYR